VDRFSSSFLIVQSMQEAFTLAFGAHSQDFDDVCAFCQNPYRLLYATVDLFSGRYRDRRRTFRPVGEEKRGEGPW
jgi:hypothetical protein